INPIVAQRRNLGGQQGLLSAIKEKVSLTCTTYVARIVLVVRRDWRRGPGSNRRIKVLQTSPLPLGYRALAGMPLQRVRPNRHSPSLQTSAAMGRIGAGDEI